MNDKEIQSKVDECLRLFNPAHSIPFPIQNIRKKDSRLMLRVAPLSDQSISGFITYDKKSDKFKIFVNSSKPRKRVNFTLAHELGHYFLHKEQLMSNDFLDGDDSLDSGNMLYRQDFGLSIKNTQLERQANKFAARLLMPEQYVRKAWAVFRNAQMCALVFDVSISAMSIRLEELGIGADD